MCRKGTIEKPQDLLFALIYSVDFVEVFEIVDVFENYVPSLPITNFSTLKIQKRFKNIGLTCVLFIFISPVLFAQKENRGIAFKTNGFNQVLEEAKQANKIIFVDLYAVWCGPCKKMEATVFNQAKLAEVYDARFVNFKVDVDSAEGKELCRKYRINSFPTYLYLSPKGEVLYRLEGLYTVEGMIEEADFASSLLE